MSLPNPISNDSDLNLYGTFIQMASDLWRWWRHTITDHLPFSFQAKVFIAGNKQGAEGF